MTTASLFVEGAEIRLDDGRTIVTCLLELCPDRRGADCWQRCPVLTTKEVSQLVEQRPDTIIAQFLRREILNDHDDSAA